MLVYEAARAEASKIREAFGMCGSGVKSLEYAAEMFEAKVDYTNWLNGNWALLIKEDRDIPRIYVHNGLSIQLKRWALARMIGLLINRINSPYSHRYSFLDKHGSLVGEFDGKEIFNAYAEEFAGELLVPEDPLIRIVNEGGEFAAAEEFNVTVPAIGRRLGCLTKRPS